MKGLGLLLRCVCGTVAFVCVHGWCFHSPVGGHLDSSQFGAVTGQAALNVGIQVFVWMLVLSSCFLPALRLPGASWWTRGAPGPAGRDAKHRCKRPCLSQKRRAWRPNRFSSSPAWKAGGRAESQDGGCGGALPGRRGDPDPVPGTVRKENPRRQRRPQLASAAQEGPSGEAPCARTRPRVLFPASPVWLRPDAPSGPRRREARGLRPGTCLSAPSWGTGCRRRWNQHLDGGSPGLTGTCAPRRGGGQKRGSPQDGSDGRRLQAGRPDCVPVSGCQTSDPRR